MPQRDLATIDWQVDSREDKPVAGMKRWGMEYADQICMQPLRHRLTADACSSVESTLVQRIVATALATMALESFPHHGMYARERSNLQGV